MFDAFPADWQILDMVEEHIPAVRNVELKAYPYPWSEGIFRDCIKDGYLCKVIFDSSGVLVAYAIVTIAVEECHLLNICVTEDCRGKGIARLLLRLVMNQANQLGAQRAFLEVRPSNPHAIQLYKTFGFIEIGRRKNYYPDTNGREDAIAMAFDFAGRSIF